MFHVYLCLCQSVQWFKVRKKGQHSDTHKILGKKIIKNCFYKYLFLDFLFNFLNFFCNFLIYLFYIYLFLLLLFSDIVFFRKFFYFSYHNIFTVLIFLYFILLLFILSQYKYFIVLFWIEEGGGVCVVGG